MAGASAPSSGGRGAGAGAAAGHSAGPSGSVSAPNGSATATGGPTGRPRKLSTATPTNAGPSSTPTPSTPASSAPPSASVPPSLQPGGSGTPTLSSTPGPAVMPGPSIAPTAGAASMHASAAGPTTPVEVETVARILLDKDVPLRKKFEITSELKDTAETQKDYAFYERYLGVLFPVISKLLLEEDKVVFVKENLEQERYRHNMFTWMSRIPRNELLKPYQPQILDMALKLLQVENEENGLMCIKLLIDAIRTNKEASEAYIERFIELIKALYANIKVLVEKELNTTSDDKKPAERPASAAGDASAPTPSGPTSSTPLVRAMNSAKCLTECPIAIVLIFQTYRSSMQAELQNFFPHAIENIQVVPELQRIALEEYNGKGELFVGISPKIQNRELFAEFYKAQTKTIAFLAYVLRNFASLFQNDYLATVPECCIRLLRSCGADDVSTRKELLIATRHVLMSEQRAVFAPYIELLMNERVLLGTSVTAHEGLRALAISIAADLIHHVRNELTMSQLATVVHTFAVCLQDSTYPTSIQTMGGKLLNTACEAIAAKGEPQEGARLHNVILTTSLERFEALTKAFERLKAAHAKDEGKEVLTEEEDLKKNGWRDIERAMPIYAISYAHESIESFCREARFLSKTLLHTIRSVCQYARQIDHPALKPNGHQIGQTLEYSVRCFAMFEYLRDSREQKEAFDLLSQILFIAEPHVFNEVWQKYMPLFIRESAIAPQFFPILQTVCTHESVSTQVVAILLKYLMENLAEFGEMSPQDSNMTLKLFKMAFTAINHYIHSNESILVPHLQKLILGCLEHSAKASEPAIYFQVLRALFRSIGGGRFEMLYKEVLPILQETLDNLAYLLAHAPDETQRDLFVELTLTVPVRLTNLLPYLNYLMRPLSHALRGGPDSVSQGLRTLELCVDNLSADFLDPTMKTVTDVLIEALNGLLKPLPANRAHAQSALKVLGKLGGRNRRFVEVDLDLEWSATPSIPVTMALEGKKHELEMGPLVVSAAKQLDANTEGVMKEAFQVLKIAVLAVLQQDGPPAEGNATFRRAMNGLITSCQKADLAEEATTLVRDICRRVFAAEVQRKDTRTQSDKVEVDIARKRYLNLTSALTDCFVDTLSNCKPSERKGVCELLAIVMQDFRDLPAEVFPTGAQDNRSIERGLQSFVHRLCALCHEEDWSRKLAGTSAIRTVLDNFETNKKLVMDLEIDFVRALLFCLKDKPKLMPRTANDVGELVKRILRVCQGSQEEHKERYLPKLIEVFVMELNSQSRLCREVVQECLQVLSEVLERPIAEIIAHPTRTKFLDPNTGPVYSKPLRALPTSSQVANIEAMTYILSLKTVMTTADTEDAPFIRTMQEVLALAEVEDAKLATGPPTHQQTEWLKQLRLACLIFLERTMTNHDFGQVATKVNVRGKVIQVYFKHIMSGTDEIKECAHQALLAVLDKESILTKVPKDAIQNGLRPILINLADANRLTVSGLDGLARFLELMTSYFKVEIGIKLLDHFRVIGDTAALNKAAYGMYEDNQDLQRMSRLIHVFRLLPPSAPQYLEPLVQYTVDAEAGLRQTEPGPFSVSLAKYLDKYHVEGCTNLFNNIRNPRFIWTYRNVIQTGQAPKLVDEIASRQAELFATAFNNHEQTDLVVAGLLIAREVAIAKKGWLSSNEGVLSSLVSVWRSILAKSRANSPDTQLVDYITIPNLMLDCYMISLEEKQHVALLFHLVEAFEIKSPIEKSRVAFFLYQHGALQTSIPYRRELLEHFFTLYETEGVSWQFKNNGMRLVVNPILRIYFAKPNDLSLFDQPLKTSPGQPNDHKEQSSPMIDRIAKAVWKPLGALGLVKHRDDTMLVELFGLTYLLVVHAQDRVVEARKEIFRFLWTGINLPEPTVKLTAYVACSRFMGSFATPFKFVKLIWTGILRLKDIENRPMYREAIDILAEVVSGKRVPKESNNEKTTPGPIIPEWASRVRAVLNEEGHGTGQLVNLCELLVHNADLFYPYREMFVPVITGSLHRLAFFAGATPELKRLSVDIVEMIFRWERRRIAAKEEADKVDDEASPAKRQRTSRSGLGTAVAAGTVASSSSGGGWVAPVSIKESISAHLLRLVSTSQEPVSKGGLTADALKLFKEMLGPKGLVVHVKLNFFNRTMKGDITDSNIKTVANSAEVLAAITTSKDQAWVRANVGTLSGLLEKVWSHDDTALHEIVEPMTLRIFKELPENEESAEGDPAKLLKFIQTTVIEGLASSLRSSSSLPGTLFLLRTWLKVQPRQLQNDAIANGMLKVLQNLSKVHMQHNNVPDPSYRLIMAVLDVLRNQPEDLREHRKTLTAMVSLLIERTQNLTLCKYLLDMLKQWVLDDPEPQSLCKEKASMLLRMSLFEHRDETLFEGYLDLIYAVYDRDDFRGTDLTHRLEPAFLHGTKSRTRRTKFLDKLEQSLPRSLDGRLQYLYSLQNWDTLADSNWIPQLLSTLLALVQPTRLIANPLGRVADADPLVDMAANAKSTEISAAARLLILHDEELAHKTFAAVFPMCWSSLTRAQQTSFTPYIIKLLSKDYMKKQVDLKPNVIQSMLEGISRCTPAVTVPPLLVKYLAKTYNAWYVGLEILGRLADVYATDDELKNACISGLSELYAELGEDDYFYGLARTRCVYPETTAALSYEQNGNWPKAIEMYETAQIRARNGLLPFSEVEYCFWEDHWILAAQKLQHWESLTELARIDQDADLLLECAWRLSDWGSSDRETIDSNINRVADIPTPRRKTFEAYTYLLKAQNSREPPNDFLRVLDEAQQVSLRRWVSLPSRHLTMAHVPLLQMFQQCVELTEASQVFESLQLTNQSNLESRANSDLKQVFAVWKERLPNFWDDISVWSDMLAWRQHVFQAVTKVYVPLIPAGEQGTYGYRGYHETAWTINRFGEVARRHNLLDVCSTSLNKIYSLPNIEITEAFLKLKEQALCFFNRADKFNEGLDNISTTNLMYFSPSQKAEFLTLKGMFVAKLGQHEDAASEFQTAIQMDMSLPKAWAEWGRFHDQLYRQKPEFPEGPPPEPEPGQPPMTQEQWNAKQAKDRALCASSAVSCYLQAAGLSGNHKSRGYLLRVLWLLSLDDNHNTISKAFDSYKGETAIWYWITLIPQLLMSLSHREAKQARFLLMLLARNYPQALFFHIRVAREEFSSVKKQHLTAQLRQKEEEAKRAAAVAAAAAAASGQTEGEGVNGAAAQAATVVAEQPRAPTGPDPPRQPWELCEEIVNLLKTSFPLLSLTMEKMVDQITIRAKPASDEDIYRFFAALLTDSITQQYARGILTDDVEIQAGTRDNMAKFSNNLPPDLKAAVERDFIREPPPLRVYVRRLMKWRDSYEKGLDARPRVQLVDQGGCNLIDFHLTKFDDVEVPGQYVHHIDPNTELVKITRFAPKFEVARGHGHCFKRISIMGSDGLKHTFGVQLPAARHCRREERLTQAFRILNSVLMRRKESRRRNLQFHLPAALTLAPQLRLTRSDSSYISLQDIYDQHARKNGRSRESASLEFHNRVAELFDPAMTSTDAKYLQLRAEVFEEIQAKMDPETILTNYFIKMMSTPESLWLMRKQFAVEMSTLSFLTYFACLTNRAPPRFHLSRKTGHIYMSEILLGFAAGQAIITAASESVPFRLTPNMQHFMGRTGVEGIMVGCIAAIARSLSPPEFELEGTLHLFVRDELLTWQASYQRNASTHGSLAQTVYTNVDEFVRRTRTMGYMNENINRNSVEPPPTVHAIVPLISEATSPLRLAQMSEPFVAWF